MFYLTFKKIRNIKFMFYLKSKNIKKYQIYVLQILILCFINYYILFNN